MIRIELDLIDLACVLLMVPFFLFMLWDGWNTSKEERKLVERLKALAEKAKEISHD